MYQILYDAHQERQQCVDILSNILTDTDGFLYRENINVHFHCPP